jgi:phosphoglucosamine mutase
LLASQKLRLERTKVGDRYVVEAMRNQGYNVGGEQSGHVVLSDFNTTGDGLIAALQVLAVLVQSGQTVSEICSMFDPVPQVLKNVRYAGGQPLETDAVKKAIAAAQEKLGNSGRLVIRKSGTEPLIRVMAEGDNADLVNSVVDDICAEVERSAA